MVHRVIMHKIILLVFILVFASLTWADQKQAVKVRAERQPIADQGNGYYCNPILAGNYGDPTVVKVGKDYTMAFSRGNGIMVWHSRDLVNWEPICRHTFQELSGIWAIDIQYFKGKYHIYMPCLKWPGKKEERYRANYVTTAEKPEGPWSEPIKVDTLFIKDDFYTGIDPGFIQTPHGEKYLYTDHGYVMPLTADGLQATALPKVVYEGWKYPADWIVQGKCLESPKLLLKDGWYYMVSAMGGTSGPSTAHMAVVARSKSPTGPWQDSPFNPLVRTFSVEEMWWHQGHATLIEGPDGSWWAIYHARLNGYTGLGRQVLMLPVEWTSDAWPVVKDQIKSWDLIPMPKGGENVGHGMVISDKFNSHQLGIQWIMNAKDKDRVTSGRGQLVIEAQGDDSSNATSISVMATNKSYEATVEVVCPEGVTAGLIFGNHEGLKTDGIIVRYSRGDNWRTQFTDTPVKHKGHVFLKIRNDHQDLSFYSSDDGVHWHTYQNGVRSGQYSIRLFANGVGKATFKNFKYLGLD